MAVVLERGEAERLRDLGDGLRAGEVLLVRAHEHGLAAEVRVAKRLREHLAGLREPRLVRGVHDEDAPVDVRGVRLPDAADAFSAAEVEQIHVEPVARRRRVVEAERRHRLLEGLAQDRLEKRGLTRAVQADEHLAGARRNARERMEGGGREIGGRTRG